MRWLLFQLNRYMAVVIKHYIIATSSFQGQLKIIFLDTCPLLQLEGSSTPFVLTKCQRVVTQGLMQEWQKREHKCDTSHFRSYSWLATFYSTKTILKIGSGLSVIPLIFDRYIFWSNIDMILFRNKWLLKSPYFLLWLL